MSIIKVKKLSKTYDYHKKAVGLKASIRGLFKRDKLFARAIQEIDFEIKEGELVGFLGPNGAGKTTTLKILSGILHPTSGEVEVLGFTPWERQKEFQKQFALVMGQKNQLWWDLPAMESFILNKEIYELSDDEFDCNFKELSELFDIKDILEIPVRKLSLGQRMKCEIVAALLHKPKILLLDEPTIGLDVLAQKNIRDFIKRYNKDHKTTIILTSHYMEDIKELCKRVIIIDQGGIMYDGQLDKLINNYAPYINLKITFSGKGVTQKEMEKYAVVEKFDEFSVELRVERNKVKTVASEILSSELEIDDIFINEMDIDSVIRRIFKNNKKK